MTVPTFSPPENDRSYPRTHISDIFNFNLKNWFEKCKKKKIKNIENDISHPRTQIDLKNARRKIEKRLKMTYRILAYRS